MSLEDIAIVGVETAGPDTTAEVLAATMAEKGIGSVVIEEARRPVGIVTDRDLAVRVVAGGADPSATTASDVMTADPTTIDVAAGVFELTAAMRRAEVRRMPVVDEGELVGIVTLDDLVHLLADELRNLAAVVEAESPPY